MTSISVIIPTYNEENYIGKLLSFLCQTSESDPRLKEIIVVDAHSTDKTAVIVQSYPVRFIESNSKNRAHQLNLGSRIAEGSLLYFVHADVIPPNQFVSYIINAIQEGHQFGCFAFRFDRDSLLLKLNGKFTYKPSKFIGGGDQTLFIEKEIFDSLGGYREDHILMEDFDLYWRANKAFRSTIIQDCVIVSSRKYVKNSWLRVQIANFIVFNAYRWGVSQQRIFNIYRFLLRP